MEITSSPEKVEVVDVSFHFINGQVESFTVRANEGDSLALDPNANLVLLGFARQGQQYSVNLQNILFTTRTKRLEAVRLLLVKT